MSAVSVSPAALEDLVDRIASFERLLDLRLARVDAAARALAATWSGNAAASYAATHARCVDDLGVMRAAAAQLRGAVATAHRNYTSAVEANARMWV